MTAAAMWTGCEKNGNIVGGSVSEGGGSSSSDYTALNEGDDTSDLVENETFTESLTITWNGQSATVNGSIDGVSVTNENGYVAVTSTVKHAAYTLTGSGKGRFTVYSDYKYRLDLSGLTLSCSDGPAVNNQCKKSCYVVVSGENTLSDGSSYASSDEDRKAAFFSEGQLIFTGTGTLNITGNYKHALASDDYIRFREGVLNLTANVTDGMHTNDGIIVDGGVITINAKNDGMQADTCSVLIRGGEVNITATDKGIWAYTHFYMTDGEVTVNAKDKGIKCYGAMTIAGGQLSVTSASDEGIESKSTIDITGGYIYAKASDDAINSGSHMTISGGCVMGYSTGNDGLDANGNFYLNGGTVYAIGARSPEVGIDANTEKDFKAYINSGNMIAVNGIESSSQIAQTCYSATVSTSSWYSLCSGGSVAVAFKPLGTSVVVTSKDCSLLSGVTTSGTAIWAGYGNTNASGGTTISLTEYSGGQGFGGGGNPGGGPGQGGHPGGWH